MAEKVSRTYEHISISFSSLSLFVFVLCFFCGCKGGRGLT